MKLINIFKQIKSLIIQKEFKKNLKKTKGTQGNNATRIR